MPLDPTVTLVVGAGTAYLYSYFTEKAKRAVVREELTAILSESRQQAAAVEQGKYDATAANLAHILLHLDKTTTAVEGVKASIADDMWLKRKVWEEKRLIYAGLLSKSMEMVTILSRVSGFSRGETQSADFDLVRALDSASELSTLFIKQKFEAALFITDEPAAGLIARFCPTAAGMSELTKERAVDVACQAYSDFVSALSTAARVDLGITPPSPATPEPAPAARR
jgi:hypothetical protein